jgi:hypothetical protein
MTFEDVLQFVYNQKAITDKRPSREDVMSLANNALDMIDIKESSWYNNDSLSGLNSMNIPEDCIEVLRVVYNSEELEYKTVYELDQLNPDWRTSTDTIEFYTLDGTNVILNGIIGVATTSILYIYGKAKLPHFPNVVGDVNPLTYLESKFHLAPAYFVLANLPVDPDDKYQVARSMRYEDRWEKALSSISGSGKVRSSKPFSY